MTSGFADVAITIGAGGLPSAGGNNAGSAGGTSRFGGIVIAPGGTPGYGSPALNPPFLFGGTGASAIPTGGNVVNAAGQTGAESIALAPMSSLAVLAVRRSLVLADVAPGGVMDFRPKHRVLVGEGPPGFPVNRLLRAARVQRGSSSFPNIAESWIIAGHALSYTGAGRLDDDRPAIERFEF